MRLGDCYFVNGDYQPAIDAYSRVVQSRAPKSDYAAYQIAMSNGLIGNTERKIQDLSGFTTRYPKSGLKDDALFELGNTYIKSERNVLKY